MTENPADGGLQIDSDWKTEAAREKERLVDQERKQSGAAQTAPEAAGDFLELVNLIAMQAAIGLGGFQAPGGDRIPPNPAAAKHHIDLLEVLQKKTEGNLTDEERRSLDSVLYELRMNYVQTVTGPPPGESDEKKS